jgi:hypothetical protein
MTLNSFIARYASTAAVLYSLAAGIVIYRNDYSNIWLVFAGSMLFSATVLTAVVQVNHRVHDSASVKSMFMVGMRTTLYGLIIASVLNLLMIGTKSIFMGNIEVSQSPDQAGADSSGDLVLILFTATVLVNAVLGALASLIGSSVAKRNQKTEKGKTIHN